MEDDLHEMGRTGEEAEHPRARLLSEESKPSPPCASKPRPQEGPEPGDSLSDTEEGMVRYNGRVS